MGGFYAADIQVVKYVSHTIYVQ